MPYMVGLTGGIGSGKSTVSDYFQQLGAHIIDADCIAHTLTAPGTEAEYQIIQHFGDNVLAPDGTLDRRALRHLIFHNQAAKQWLEAYLHPLISAQIQVCQQVVDAPYALIVLPIVHADTKKRYQLDVLYAVCCAQSTQIERVMHRDRHSAADAKHIIIQQHYEHAAIDAIIDNNSSLADLHTHIRSLHAQFLHARR